MARAAPRTPAARMAVSKLVGEKLSPPRRRKPAPKLVVQKPSPLRGRTPTSGKVKAEAEWRPALAEAAWKPPSPKRHKEMTAARRWLDNPDREWFIHSETPAKSRRDTRPHNYTVRGALQRRPQS